ncbi:MAG: putative ester cyclase [Acidimicrobiales bacterium]|nr:putative ester cyclase [Acidimicrobiales bacterium]
MDDELLARRDAILREHFETEVSHQFDRTLATFGGHPHYEIMATGQVFDGDEEVLGYYLTTRTAFPDQRHDGVTIHHADGCAVAEFDLLGTNTGELYGRPPTGKAFRVPVCAIFFFEGADIVNERIYFDTASLLSQIGHGELLAPLAGA